MSSETRIGWASSDITPTRPVLLRGLFNLRVATRVQDPLTLTALALETESDQAILVSIDICGVDEAVLAAARAELAASDCGLDPDKVVASATHTHTGPFASSDVGLQKDQDYIEALRKAYPDYMSVAEYTDGLVNALVTTVRTAWENRQPGRLAWGYSYAVVGENRRIRYFDDRSVMYGKTSEADFSHVEGHVDHTVNLLFTYSTDDVLTGVLVNVACPSQANEGGQDYLSADYWHDVRDELRRRYGSHLAILPQCSAAGDQTPHRMIGAKAEDRMLRLKYGEGLGRSSNLALRRDIARRIADAVDDAEPAVAEDRRSQVVLSHRTLRLDLPHWDVTEREYATLTAEIADLRKQLESLHDADPLSARRTALRSRINWCRRAVDRYENPPASVPIEMAVLRLGDVAFVTSPFEYYLDFGDRLKGRSPAVQTFVVQLAGGGTYLPTSRAAAGCSYGAVPASCKVSPEGGQIMVDAAVALLKEMFAE